MTIFKPLFLIILTTLHVEEVYTNVCEDLVTYSTYKLSLDVEFQKKHIVLSYNLIDALNGSVNFSRVLLRLLNVKPL